MSAIAPLLEDGRKQAGGRVAVAIDPKETLACVSCLSLARQACCPAASRRSGSRTEHNCSMGEFRLHDKMPSKMAPMTAIATASASASNIWPGNARYMLPIHGDARADRVP